MHALVDAVQKVIKKVQAIQTVDTAVFGCFSLKKREEVCLEDVKSAPGSNNLFYVFHVI